jgi:hypothetical protein
MLMDMLFVSDGACMGALKISKVLMRGISVWFFIKNVICIDDAADLSEFPNMNEYAWVSAIMQNKKKA